MKTLSLLFTVIFSLVVSIASAQDEMFKVIASKGAKLSAESGERSLKIGEKLFKGQKITLSDGSYLGLAHKTGKTIELKKPGTYEIDKLSGEVAAQNSSVTKKYVDFVAAGVSSGNEDMAKNRHKYMDVTGSVKRGGSNSVNVLVPGKAYFVSSPVFIKWDAAKGVKTYVVKVRNMFDEPVFEKETSETSMLIDLGKVDFNNENDQLILKIVSKDDATISSEDYQLKHYNAEKTNAINKELSDLKLELNGETALNKIVLASYFEEKGLLMNAIEAYEQAIKLEPEVEDYKTAYNDFLVRNGLVVKKEEKK